MLEDILELFNLPPENHKQAVSEIKKLKEDFNSFTNIILSSLEEPDCTTASSDLSYYRLHLIDMCQKFDKRVNECLSKKSIETFVKNMDEFLNKPKQDFPTGKKIELEKDTVLKNGTCVFVDKIGYYWIVSKVDQDNYWATDQKETRFDNDAPQVLITRSQIKHYLEET